VKMSMLDQEVRTLVGTAAWPAVPQKIGTGCAVVVDIQASWV